MSRKFAALGIDPASPDGDETCFVLARMRPDGTVEVLKASHNPDDLERWTYIRPAVISVRAEKDENQGAIDANHE
jgi:hypothetical protein